MSIRLALLEPDADDAVIDGFLAALGVRTERAADPDDHYYGAWSGGKKSEGGHPEGEEPKKKLEPWQRVRIVHHSEDPDPYGEKMDIEAAARAGVRNADDQTAIGFYQSVHWLDVNDRLRAGLKNPAGDEDIGSVVERMDAMMTSEGGMPFETDVWRGVYSNNVFPGDNLTDTVFQDRGYISTSANRDSAEAFSFPGGGRGGNIMMRIRVPKGWPCIVADGEVILPRGTKFRIVSDTFGGPSGYVTNEPTGFEHKVKRVIVAEVQR